MTSLATLRVTMCCRKCDILSNETRAADCVVRVGGDEFVLIFVRVTDPVFLHRIAQRIIAKLDEPVLFDQHSCFISRSAGKAISHN